MVRITRTVVFIGTIVAGALCMAKDKSLKAPDVIDRATQLADIRADGQPPFHLKAEFTYFAQDRTIQGTYLEDWVSSRQWRRETVGMEIHKLEVAAETKLWTVSDGGLAAFLYDYSAYTLNSYRHSDSLRNAPVHHTKSGGPNETCIGNNGFERCFDDARGWLTRSITSNRLCRYENYQPFSGKVFPHTIRCFYSGKPSMEVRVAELVIPNKVDPEIFTPVAGSKEGTNCLGNVGPAHLLMVDMPNWHGLDRPGVFFTIGVDGKPADMIIVRSSGNAITDRSWIHEANGEWRFAPATCDGKPMDSTMTAGW
jgi:hypothetical protein